MTWKYFSQLIKEITYFVIPSISWWKKYSYKILLSNIFPTDRAFTLCCYWSTYALLAKNMTTHSWHFFDQRIHTYWAFKDNFLWRFRFFSSIFILQNKCISQQFEILQTYVSKYNFLCLKLSINKRWIKIASKFKIEIEIEMIHIRM